MGLQFLGESDEQLKSSLSFPADFSVAKILKTDVLYCSPSTSLNEAASLMQERNCSSIIVLDNNSPKGIWTEQDALLIDFDDPAQFTRPINEVMSQPVISIHADTLLSSVATQLQKNKLRHFLVVDDDENTLGLLSQSDIVEHQVLEHYLDLRSTASVLRRNIPRLAADTLLSYAVRKMQLSASSAIIINYPDQSYGILTERDLVHLIAQQSSKQTVGDVASRPLICIPHDMSLYRARKTLSERGIRHVGVTQNGELLGLVSFREIMMDVESAYMNELREVLQVRDQALSAAKRNLQLAERVIDSTLEGVIITDPRGRILFVNPAFSKITGYSDAEVIGKTPAILKSGHHNNDFYQSMWLELQRGSLGR